MKGSMWVSRLTPAFQRSRTSVGRVHSIFEHALNLKMRLYGGEERLLTLVGPDSPRLPDSLCLPCFPPPCLTVGMPARLEGGIFKIGRLRVPLCPDTHWTGQIPRYEARPDIKALERLADGVPCGLDRLPQPRRDQVREALSMGTAAASQFVGLGWGLTPSYDDACVGMLAAYRAQGKRPPFETVDTSRTTDVSARYLKLAIEGYFGEPLCALLAAVYGQGDLARSVERLLQVGATSGADMLYGVRLAFKTAGIK